MSEIEPAPSIGSPPSLPPEVVALTPDREPFSLVTGIAGTGKSWLLRAWAEADHTAELCATTGIAAVNLAGSTVNALLSYFDTASLREAFLAGYLHTRIKMLLRGGTRRLLLDEMSMLDAEQLTLLVEAIDEVNRQCRLGQAGGGLTADDQFGLTLCGDFGQLPPVKAAFAFSSPHWPRFEANALHLTTIRRQSDRGFIEALHAVRRGEITDETIETLRPAMTLSLDDHFDGTTLVAKNDEVDRLNRLRYLQLGGHQACFPTHRHGEQLPEWTRYIPNEVALKPGALVMLLANHVDAWTVGRPVYRYINGDLGHVEELAAPARNALGLCAVRLLRAPDQVTEVSYVTRERYDPRDAHRPIADRRVLGSVSYLPVRLAYATTCHKAQGLSFDRVQVTFKNPFWSQPAMAYVALSRARSLDGLRLIATPEWLRARAKMSPMVKRWL